MSKAIFLGRYRAWVEKAHSGHSLQTSWGITETLNKMSPSRVSVRPHPGCCRRVEHVLCPGRGGHCGFLTATVPQSRPGPAKPFCPRGHTGSRRAWPECPEASVPWGSVGCLGRACWWEKSGCRLWSVVRGPRALHTACCPQALGFALTPWPGCSVGKASCGKVAPPRAS